MCVAVFSIKGSRALCDKITGSDLDGDVFTVIWNAKLLSCWPQHDPQPWETPARLPLQAPQLATSMAVEAAYPLPVEKAAYPLLHMPEGELKQNLFVRNYLSCCKSNELVIDVATNWKAVSDADGVNSDKAIKLAYLYMEACDASKADDSSLHVPHALCARLPYYLTAKADLDHKAREEGTSALGRMWAAVSSGRILQQTMPTATTASDTGVWIDEQLRVVDSKGLPFTAEFDWRKTWEKYFKEYKDRLGKEVLSLVKDGVWTDVADIAFRRLIFHYRSILLADRDPSDLQQLTPELLAEASSLYAVVYQAAGKVSFAWSACSGIRTAMVYGIRTAMVCNNGVAALPLPAPLALA